MNEKKIRVAMMIQAYLPRFGGAERQLSALLPLLRQRGVDTFVLTRRYDGLSKFEIIDETEVYRLPIPGPKPVAALSYIAAAQIHIARLRPDVIHAHELLSPASAAQLARSIWGIPIVAKVLGGGKNGDIDKLEHRPFGKYRLSALREQISAFIAVSSEINNELTRIGIPASRRVFIPNGVDAKRFSPVTTDQKMQLRQRLRLPDQATIAVFSGRLVPGKQVDLLLEVWRDLQREFRQSILVIVGSGGEETRLRQMNVENVHFAGQVDDVAPYLQSSDFFILPSAAEGLSNALLEALAVGLPCVATAVGGTLDVIVDGENGLLVATDLQHDLRTALSRLLTDIPMRQRMGKLARETILARYSLEGTADRLASLYFSLAKERKAKG